MASKIGMAARNEMATARIDAALAALDATHDLPDRPAPSRDAVFAETQRLEWLADVLEAIATRPAAKPAGAAASARKAAA